MPGEKWLTATEAANLLGVSDRTLRRYVQQGRLAKHRFATERGNEYRFSEDGVLKLKTDMTEARLRAGHQEATGRTASPHIATGFDIVKFLDKYEAAIQQLGYLQALSASKE
jgi:excisionase family DNA binding protein